MSVIQHGRAIVRYCALGLVLSIVGGYLCAFGFVDPHGGLRSDLMSATWTMDCFAERLEAAKISFAACSNFTQIGERISSTLPDCPFAVNRDNPFPTELFPCGEYGHINHFDPNSTNPVPVLWLLGDNKTQPAIRRLRWVRIPTLIMIPTPDKQERYRVWWMPLSYQYLQEWRTAVEQEASASATGTTFAAAAMDQRKYTLP